MWLLDHWQFEAGDVVSIERVSVRCGDCGLNFLFLWRSTAVPALNVCDFVAADFLCYRLVWALNNHLWTSSLLNNLKLLTSDPRITSFHYMLPHRWPVLICGDPVIYLIQSVLLVNATITVIRSCKVSNYITSACDFTYSEYVLVCIYGYICVGSFSKLQMLPYQRLFGLYFSIFNLCGMFNIRNAHTGPLSLSPFEKARRPMLSTQRSRIVYHLFFFTHLYKCKATVPSSRVWSSCVKGWCRFPWSTFSTTIFPHSPTPKTEKKANGLKCFNMETLWTFVSLSLSVYTMYDTYSCQDWLWYNIVHYP